MHGFISKSLRIVELTSITDEIAPFLISPLNLDASNTQAPERKNIESLDSVDANLLSNLFPGCLCRTAKDIVLKRRSGVAFRLPPTKS